MYFSVMNMNSSAYKMYNCSLILCSSNAGYSRAFPHMRDRLTDEGDGNLKGTPSKEWLAIQKILRYDMAVYLMRHSEMMYKAHAMAIWADRMDLVREYEARYGKYNDPNTEHFKYLV